MRSVKLVVLFFTIGLFSFDKPVQFDDTWSIQELHKKAALFDSLDHDSTLFYGKALLKRSKSEENDLFQAKAHYILGNYHYVRFDMSSAILEYEKALEKYERLNAPSSHALTLYSLALAYFNQADYQRSIQYAHRTDSMKSALSNEINSQNQSLLCDLYYFTGFYEVAFDYCLRAEQLYDTIDINEQRSALYNTIGNIHLELKQKDKAINFFVKALDYAKTYDSEYEVATCYSNMGDAFSDTRNYDSAIYYYRKAFELDSLTGDSVALGYSYFKLATAYFENKNFEQAEYNFESCMQLLNKVVDEELEASLYAEYGALLTDQQRYEEALTFLKKSLALAQHMDSNPLLKDCYLNLSKYYAQIGDFEEAFVYQKMHTMLQEEIWGMQNTRKMAEKEVQYELSNKEKEIELLERQNKITELKARQRYIVIICLIAGLVLIGVLAYFYYSRFKIKKRSNKILEEQHGKLEKLSQDLLQKNVQITDGLQYAKKLQDTLLVNHQYFKECFSDNFIVEIPKSVVSGDFYWCYRSGRKTWLAVADCTGHGVAGAFMTLLAHNSLEEIAREDHSECPKKVVDLLQLSIASQLKDSESSLVSQNGIEIFIGIFDLESRSLSACSTGIPLFLAREGSIEKIERNGLKSGLDLTWNKGDILYLCTDGFIDQFGGQKNKKLKRTGLQEMLESLQDKQFDVHQNAIIQEFENWKGDAEQVDDVLFTGVKLP